MKHVRTTALLALAASLVAAAAGCRKDREAQPPLPGAADAFQPRLKAPAARQLERRGTEIMVAGQLFDVDAPVVLWTDPKGYDAYRTERRFSDFAKSDYAATTQAVKDINSPARYNLRRDGLTPEEIEQVRGGGWTLPMLQDKVDQFVIHYDVCGTSKRCFQVLHDMRGLSVHFMLDIDGTIYQTLDLKERAWHAGQANGRSIGIEIANMGAYATNESPAPLEEWYETDADGVTRITIPPRLGDGGVLTPNFVGYPMRAEPVYGEVQGKIRKQYDFTPEQYASLIKLTAALCTIFPKINCDYPRDQNGQLITHVLPKEQFEGYQGLIGHYHVSGVKSDPGPAFQWDLVVNEARREMGRK